MNKWIVRGMAMGVGKQIYRLFVYRRVPNHTIENLVYRCCLFRWSRNRDNICSLNVQTVKAVNHPSKPNFLDQSFKKVPSRHLQPLETVASRFCFNQESTYLNIPRYSLRQWTKFRKKPRLFHNSNAWKFARFLTVYLTEDQGLQESRFFLR